MRKIVHLLTLLSCLTLYGQSEQSHQVDTSALRLDILSLDDLNPTKSNFDSEIISGFKIPVNNNDLPATVFIITQDEILLNGYNTLVDAIASLPGIRVSQPGSGEDGETFMMQGLYGNTYTKILINDVPVKPFVLKAMPLGAQLPIKNVDRIEVLLGPAASLHGTDATAGIINIITKKNLKPQHVQANYSIGNGVYQNISVAYETNFGLFGKRLGLGLYGSVTQADRLIVDYNDSDLDYDIYALDSLYTQSDNFDPTRATPLVDDFPQTSRLLGLQLNLGNLKYESQLMYRRDHSSLGLNPTAVAYNNPLNYIGESINNLRLSYEKKFREWEYSGSANLLLYNMDRNSSHTYLAPLDVYLASRFEELIQNNGERSDSLRQLELQENFSGLRHRFGSSREFNTEQSISRSFNDRHSLTFIAKFESGSGRPLIEFLDSPITKEQRLDLNMLGVSHNNFSGFLQLFLNYDKLKIMLDGNFGEIFKTEFVDGNVRFTTRIAVGYALMENLNLRTTYNRSLRVPTLFHQAEYFFFDTENTPFSFPSESSEYFNLGFNWQVSDKTLIDLSYYSYDINRHLIFSATESQEGESLRYIYGYAPETATFKDINGIQLFMRSQDLFGKKGYNLDASADYTWGREGINTAALDFDGLTSSIEELRGVRGVPDFMAKVSFNANIYNNFYVKFQTTYYSPGVPFSLINYLRNDSQIKTDSGVIFNTAFRFQLSRSFGIHVQAFNLFDTNIGGIDANDTLDVLNQNPQRRRSFRLGIDYSIR